ncbi:MAG: hypothetical protein ABI039_13990 [Vicinamibacterales bacterium]
MNDPIYMTTLNGLVDLTSPDPALITTRAIAYGLAKINRWAGNTELPVTDAQHSLLVAQIFRKIRPALARWSITAELHDAHEYLIGDVLAPTTKLLTLRLPGFGRHLEAEKLRLDEAIRQALGLPSPPPALAIEIAAAVHDADLCAYDVEWRSFIPPSNGPSPYAEHGKRHGVAGMRIKAMPWVDAEVKLFESLDAQLAGKAWELAA